jgi:hypothetical protein
LNILGKKNMGSGWYNNTDRHTMFVPLDGNVTITYELGHEFGVLDGNGVDDGMCVLQIPNGKEKNFAVVLVSLGKPRNYGATVDYPENWTYYNETNEWIYVLGTFDIKLHNKKPEWMDITEVFNVTWAYYNETDDIWGILYEGYIWNVNEELYGQTGYFWDYKHTLRHIQVRFYPC